MATTEELLTELSAATQKHNNALNKESEARRECTFTLNALNAAQKKVDEHFAALRAKAPRGSDWNTPAALSASQSTEGGE